MRMTGSEVNSLTDLAILLGFCALLWAGSWWVERRGTAVCDDCGRHVNILHASGGKLRCARCMEVIS